MAISKITLNGVTQMDVTQKTVTANKMLNGTTALKNDGTDIEGNIPTKTSSNLTVSGAIVTAPAGYYESDASKSVASMSLPTTTASSATSGYTSKATIGRSTSDQYINIPTGYNASGAYYKVSAVANGSAQTPATGITANPTINVDTSTGLITATTSVTKSVTPTVSAGYVSSGTAGTITVSGSNSKQLTVTAAQTVTPTESEQTAVAADRYTIGTVKVGAIPSTYVGSEVAQNDSDDLTVSGGTITAPAGFYAEDASKSVASMTLPTAATSSATSGFTSKATISRSASDQYINIPTGYNSTGAYYKVSAVANGTAGTPIATKGTVSNNSISITPSVTNTTGYITGGTKTGTAVTVSASELVDGTYSVTGAGTKNVTNYASISVPAGIVTAPSSISGSSATVSTGTNTLTLTKTVSVTPAVSTTGYVSSGTAGNSSISLTASVNTRSSSDLTASGATITAPAGYYSAAASASVASGTTGTPTATKGTVSNHTVTVTPSVTNTTGYITGGTKTGTGILVSASELVSGSKTISRNGRFDISNLAQVVTSFPDACDFESGTFSPSSDVVTYNIPFVRTHSKMPFFAMVVDSTGTYDSTEYTSMYMCYHNYLQSWNIRCKMSSTANAYGTAQIAYRSTNAKVIDFRQYPFYYSSGDTDQNHPQYWVTNTEIKATTTSSAYWRAGRVYRWFAMWNSQIDPAWELGAINTSTGEHYDNTIRMRTAKYIPVNSSVYVSLKNGAKVTISGWDASYHFLEAGSWISTSFYLQSQVSTMTNAQNIEYVKLMASYSDDTDITDIDDLIADVEITGMI